MIHISSASIWAARCDEISSRRGRLASRAAALARTSLCRRTFLSLRRNRDNRYDTRAQVFKIIKKLADGTTQIAIQKWKDLVIFARHAEQRADKFHRLLSLSHSLDRWKRSTDAQLQEREERLRTATQFRARRCLTTCISRWRLEVKSTKRFQWMALQGTALLMGKGLVQARFFRSWKAFTDSRKLFSSALSRAFHQLEVSMKCQCLQQWIVSGTWSCMCVSLILLLISLPSHSAGD